MNGGNDRVGNVTIIPISSGQPSLHPGCLIKCLGLVMCVPVDRGAFKW